MKGNNFSIKNLLFVLLFCPLFFISCSKDNEINISCASDEIFIPKEDIDLLFSDIEITVIRPDLQLSSISFISETVGYAVDAKRENQVWRNKIVKTIDGGDSWTDIYEKEGALFSDIHFFDNKIGVVLAEINEKKYLLRIKDDGKSVSEHLIEGNKISSKINFLNEHIGFIGSGDRELFSTFDGGRTWKTDKMNVGYYPTLSNYKGNTYLVGAEVIYISTDCGQNWTAKNPEFVKWIYGFGNYGDDFYIMADELFKTDVGFNSSDQKAATDRMHILKPYDKNTIIGFASSYVGGEAPIGIMYLSNDDGQTWDSYYGDEFSLGINKVIWYSEKNAYALSDLGTLTRITINK